MSLPPLSLYVHLPWCIKKCLYCDFNAHAVNGDIPETEYLEALKKDLDQELSAVRGRQLQTIFFGGGTPSLMSPAFYQQLLSHIKSVIPWQDNIEITMEANPGTIDQRYFNGFAEAGINRISIGIQSFNDQHLEALGRQHDSQAATQSVYTAQQAGIDNINIDIMHALPQQTPAQALLDLQKAVELGPTHISWYELTIEQNSVFFSYPPRQPDPDVWADIEQEGFTYLYQQGFTRYEVSAFAQTSLVSQHNMNYWTFADYLAIGAGAHGKFTDPKGNIYRYQKTRLPKHYLAENGYIRRHLTRIPQKDLPFEFMLNALRLTNGVPSELYEQRAYQPLNSLEPHWQSLKNEGLMVNSDSLIGCTNKGLLFLNHVLNRFV